MINYRNAEQKDIDEIMEISDIKPEYRDESRNTLIDRISGGQLLCCNLDNKIIGFLGWNTKFNNNPEHWFLEQITIQKEYRNRKIGQNFIKYFLEICRKNKIKKLYGHIEKDNDQSLKMFLSAGAVINKELGKNKQEGTTIGFSFV